MNFERGKDVKSALGIGGHRSNIKAGDYFFVRFRIRESHPAYYEYQKREREGKFAEAYAREEVVGLVEGKHIKNLVKCIVNGIRGEEFIAFWEEDENCWVIQADIDWVTPREL